MARPKLYLNHDPKLDWLIALEFGAVDDDLPAEQRRIVSDSFCYVLGAPGGEPIGFVIARFSSFDPEDGAHTTIWGPPRFDAPVLGLRDVSAGEAAVAARAFFAGRHSVNRMLFHLATNSEGDEAASFWQSCLEAGDSMAHFGLGYTLVDLGRPREAYPHLRAYTELVPQNSWAWCWLGQACEALGDIDEARKAYERAVLAERKGAEETDAVERLARLEDSESS